MGQEVQSSGESWNEVEVFASERCLSGGQSVQVPIGGGGGGGLVEVMRKRAVVIIHCTGWFEAFRISASRAN